MSTYETAEEKTGVAESIWMMVLLLSRGYERLACTRRVVEVYLGVYHPGRLSKLP
jgi:hypothetical protein